MIKKHNNGGSEYRHATKNDFYSNLYFQIFYPCLRFASHFFRMWRNDSYILAFIRSEDIILPFSLQSCRGNRFKTGFWAFENRAYFTGKGQWSFIDCVYIAIVFSFQIFQGFSISEEKGCFRDILFIGKVCAYIKFTIQQNCFNLRTCKSLWLKLGISVNSTRVIK